MTKAPPPVGGHKDSAAYYLAAWRALTEKERRDFRQLRPAQWTRDRIDEFCKLQRAEKRRLKKEKHRA